MGFFSGVIVAVTTAVAGAAKPGKPSLGNERKY